MMVTTVTVPFCGSCGWDVVSSPNLNDDAFCDSCGADLGRFGFGGVAPTDLAATPELLGVDFTWTANPDADSTDFGYTSPEGGAWTVVPSATSPGSIATIEGGIAVCAQVRSVIDGVPGPWSAEACAVSTA